MMYHFIIIIIMNFIITNIFPTPAVFARIILHL